MNKAVKLILLTILTIVLIIPGVVLVYELNHALGLIVGIIAAFALLVMAK